MSRIPTVAALVYAIASVAACDGQSPTLAAPTSPATPPSVAGVYTLTLTAADTCVPDRYYAGTLGIPAALPAEARRRSYTAAIAQDAARLTVNLSGGEFVLSQPHVVGGDHIEWYGNSFRGVIPYNGASFWDQGFFMLKGGDPGDLTIAWAERGWSAHDVLERISPTTFLGISGSALGPHNSTTIDAPLDGTFWLYSYGGSGDIYSSPDVRLIGVCKSPAHRMVFERADRG